MSVPPSLRHIASCKLPTPWGEFTMHGFEEASGQEHVALTFGDVSGDAPVLVRLHSECLTGDALFSLRCDCGFQLEAALDAIAEVGRVDPAEGRHRGRRAGAAQGRPQQPQRRLPEHQGGQARPPVLTWNLITICCAQAYGARNGFEMPMYLLYIPLSQPFSPCLALACARSWTRC